MRLLCWLPWLRADQNPAEVTAGSIPATEPARSFVVAFFFCMLPGIAGILLMCAVREREHPEETGGEVAIGF